MATRTRVNLAEAAMREIKKLSVGEEFAPEDQNYVLGVIDEADAELDELEIVYWDQEEIPEAMFPSYKRLIAADIAGRYTSLAEAQYYLALRTPAIQNMRRLTTRQKPPVEDERSYF